MIMNIENIIKSEQAMIIDVRTPEEFSGGHVAGSVNIPLHEIPQRINELKDMQSTILLCCASGRRSSQAYHFLKQHGLECYNGGSWTDINFYKSKIN